MTRIQPSRRTPWRSHVRAVAAAAAVGAMLGGAAVLGGIAPLPSASADTSSAVTVTARSQDADIADAPFPDLAVTVSQTRDLQAQGIQISWTGGSKSEVPSGQTGGKDFLQIMQCWGDDPENPGQPDRRTCQYGAFKTPGSTRDSNVTEGSIADEDLPYTSLGGGFIDPPYTSIPFLSATGKTIESVVDGKRQNVDVNVNEFFTGLTSNEISWAGSSADGKGLAKFEVQTAAQAPGLGCGAEVGTPPAVTGAPCWLVVLPRGTADPGEQNVITSGLFWENWKHRIAVKLDFRPIGVRCVIGAPERQIAGSELASDAIASWQPSLCGAAGGSTYTGIVGSEADAALAANGTAPAPLALTSRALAAEVPDKLAYAPVALSGVAIAFAIDAEPNPLIEVPEDVAGRARQPFTSMNLTPRLVAKLLTNSYVDSLPTGAEKTHIGFLSPADPGHNARNLTSDPDFLAVNPGDWEYQSINAASVADMLIPQGRSDAADAVWRYVVADAEAADFLAGKPDEWGMIVNPYSSTDAELNANKVAFALPRNDFPKADPAEQPVDPAGAGPVNVVTWRPYTNDLATTGYDVLRGDGLLLGPWDPNALPPKYGKTPRALAGLQRVIGLTDTAAAARYQVFTASLRNPAGEFVAPTADSMTAAAAAMSAGEQTQVYSFDPASATAKAAPTAYPLTLPVYAAVNPAMKDADARAAYAEFIEYAAAEGQEPGTDLGQLPAGYAPLPAGWRSQALAAAEAIRAGGFPAPSPTPSAPKPAAAPVAPVGAPAPVAPAPAPAPAAVAPPAAQTDPRATGEVAGALTGAKTAADPELGGISAIVPVVIVLGLLTALAVPFLTRVFGRRRAARP
ncbi:hypothetical protein [Herbiconiux sp. VKM Ac-2851]|uniref:hypothetical protein n=1 Tax=Herbiconiux sp. VKM Ac-2851 TaxID=2739025 RepID=UPI001563AD40|nr:hypothetical protein [Herbiconiux sp. VKM Ac-2851]NQX36543.1 hypothetical protein [Herbiconiux sp. VKM Ac-2851]